jgi:purine catabolism regulator
MLIMEPNSLLVAKPPHPLHQRPARDHSQLSVSVTDCLQMAPLDQVEVIAGAKGLDRRFQWVHVVDHREIEDSLDGDELLLTSGVSLANDAVFQSEIFAIMERKRSAGLVIAIGQYMADIPDPMRRLADEYEIPILAIPWEVNFVDITRVLLTQLVQSHYRFMELSQSLNQKLLETVLQRGDMAAICDCIHRVMESDVAIYDDSLKLIQARSVQAERSLFDAPRLRKALSSRLLSRDGRTSAQIVELDGKVRCIAAPIRVSGCIRGQILIQAEEANVAATLRLGEIAATIASLVMAREDELLKVTRQSDARLLGILEGAIPARAAGLLELGLKGNEPVSILVLDFEPEVPQAALSLVHGLLKHSVAALTLAVRGHCIFGLVQKPKGHHSEWAYKLEKHLRAEGLAPQIGITEPIKDPCDIAERCEDVKELLRLRHFLQPSDNVINAEHSVVTLRALRHMAGRSDVRDLCPAIVKIREHDRSLHGSLIEALACLLEVDGNVSLAARRLGVHRHTVLYRLNRIKEILGTDLSAAMRFELRLQLLAWSFAGAAESD